MKKITLWAMPICVAICALLGLQASTVHAAPQYSLDCSSCHQMPPLDSTNGKKDPTTGSIPGDHQKHAGEVASTCVKCHGDEAKAYTTSHRNKIIELSDGLGYGRKQAGVFMNQTAVPPLTLSTCSTAACHSNGKGAIRETPAWNSVDAATCDTCHDATPTTNSHTKHITDNNIGCVKCHSDHSVEAKPFQHATSAGRSIDVHFTVAPNSGGSFATNQCSNLYCHSNGQAGIANVSATPTWGGSATTCASCHGDATTDTLSGKHAKHVNNTAFLGTNYGCVDCHNATVSSNTTISDKTKHIDGNRDVSGAKTGTVTAGSCSTSACHSDGKGTNVPVTWTQTETLGCNGCHGTTTTTGAPDYANVAAGNVKANSHSKHAATADTCANCHSNTTSTGTAIIANSQHIDGYINFTSGNGKTFGKQANKTCSNISCHSGNGRVQSVPNAQWGATLGCEGCHTNANLSGAHAAHIVTRAYGCEQCHSNTASSSTALKAGTALHMNYSTNVSLATGTYNGNLTCTTSACHATATPNWKVASSGQCGTCHKATSATTGGLIATNAHTAHFSAVYGPGLNGAVDTSCAACHTYTGTNTATHPDSTVNLAAGFATNGTCGTCHTQATDWTAAGTRLACESCHTGTLSVINGVTAPDKSLAATVGHVAEGYDCTTCHDNTAAHISGSLGVNQRLVAGFACASCHVDNGAAPQMQTHVGFANACTVCHDPHGTANSNMVMTNFSTNKGTTVSFSNLGENTVFVNDSGTGVCQTCHTNTSYYKKNVAETNHNTGNCLECHPHNATSGTAFEPARNCNSCHGYPPAPRSVLNTVTFGVQGNWSTARFEDYSGGGGAHLVASHIPKSAKPSDGWSNCLPCHFGGPDKHAKATPVRTHVENITVSVDPQLRFSNDNFIVYTSATLTSDGANKSGSCFNVSCHMAKSPKWSTER